MNENASKPVVNPADAKTVQAWKYEPSPLISCRFDPLGRFVFAGAQDNHVLRLHLDTGEFVPLVGHGSWVRAMGFSPDGARCWTGGYDGRLITWETASDPPQPLGNVEAHQGWIRSLDVSPDGRFLVTGGNDHLVRIWGTDSGELLHTCTGHDRHVYSVRFAADSQSVFSGDLRGQIKRWNCETGSELAAFEAVQLYTPNPGQAAEYGGIRSMVYLAEPNQLVCGGLHNASNPFGAVQEPLVVGVDCGNGQTVRTHTAKDGPKAICWRVVHHPQGFLIGGCGGTAGGFVCFWRAEAEHEFHRLTLPNTVLDMDLDAPGVRIATVHYDRHVRLTHLAGA